MRVSPFAFLWTVLALTAITSIADANAQDLPEWVSKSPEDNQNFYGVGIGDGSTEAGARSAADQDAIRKLFDTVFGMRLSVQQKGNSSLKVDSLETVWTSDLDGGFLDKIMRVECINSPAEKPMRITAYCMVKIKKAIALQHKKSYESNKPKTHGILSVDTNPNGATLSVDDKKVGETPVRLSLFPGTYSLTVWKPGFRTVEKKVTLRAGEKLSSLTQMESDTGTLKVSCNAPSATLIVDESEVPGTGFWQVELKTGRHRISLKAPARADYIDSFELEGGETKELDIKLIKQTNITGNNDQGLSQVEKVARNILNEKNWGELLKYSRANRQAFWARNSYYYEGRSLYKMGMYQQAIEAFLNSIARGESPANLTGLCESLGALEKFAEANRECDRAILLDPTNSSPFVVKARIAIKQYESYPFNNFRGAKRVIDAYQIAIRVDESLKPELDAICAQANGFSDLAGACRRRER